MNIPAGSDGLLARVYIERHPGEAAALLDGLDPDDAAAVLDDAPLEYAPTALCLMASASAAAALAALPPTVAAGLISRMPADTVAVLLRRMPAALVDSLLDALPGSQAAALRSGLEFSDRSIGALMDPRAPTATPDLTAEQAIKRLRSVAAYVNDEVYVVDRDQELVGVLPMRVLVVSAPAARVDAIMQPARYRVSPHAGPSVIYRHPAWDDTRTLPVVAENGRFLGVLGYDVVARAVRDTDAPRLVETSVGTLANFSELCYVGSVHVLASVVSILTERVERLGVEAR